MNESIEKKAGEETLEVPPGIASLAIKTQETPSDPPPAAEEAPPAEPEEPQEDGRLWYIVQTQTSQEERVKSSIAKQIEQHSIAGKVFQVVVPEEEVVEIKENKRMVRRRKLYPGYVFIEMVLDDEAWYAIRQTTGVAKFIGSKTKPIPVAQKEMIRVLRQTGVKSEVVKIQFEIGESIRIISGPFRGHTGSVNDINASKGTMRALINIFGRDTPVELEFSQAEKL